MSSNMQRQTDQNHTRHLNRDTKRQKSLVMQKLRENKHQHNVLYPAKLPINIEEETKIFQDKINSNNIYLSIQPYREF